MKELVLTQDARQELSTTINGKAVTLRPWYNRKTDRWTVDLDVNGTPRIAGRKLVAGTNLLADLGLDIGILIVAEMSEGAEPDRTAFLNGGVKLFSVSQDEYDDEISSEG